MRVSYTNEYFVQLPEGHAFPMGKFPALKNILEQEKIISAEDIVVPREADWEKLLLAHSSRYLESLANGSMTRKEERRMGLPWSEALVKRSRLAVQGTLNAMSMSIDDGLAANLAGGTHHACYDHAEGFCVLNDVVVGLKTLLQDRWIRSALVVDLDVHQGNGNAEGFAGDKRVFTFSMHGAKNFPFEKPASDLDIALEDGTEDELYLELLENGLTSISQKFSPDFLVYLAGVDVLRGDRFGRLDLSRQGLEERDRLVAEFAKNLGIPLVLLLSGGYSQTPELTADHHASAHRIANAILL